MKIVTLAFLFRDDKILLSMKKRGFGIGKWNGYGGKLLDGETPIDGLIREIKEESCLSVDKDACKELGYMDFSFTDKAEWDQRVMVYRIDEFSGEPIETEEMKPAWFSLDEIPYGEMWAGDDQWIPNIVAGKNFTGEILFSDGGEKIVRCDIK